MNLTEGDKEVMNQLSETSVLGVEEFIYELKTFDGRRSYQVLTPLSDPSTNDLYIATSHLKKIGATQRGCGLAMRVIKFDSGQVLSYFTTHEFQMSEEVLTMLDECVAMGCGEVHYCSSISM